MIRSLLSRLPAGLKGYLKYLLDTDSVKSYSQFGEDAFVHAYFLGKSWRNGKSMALPHEGFYVDIGAYSPTECSNTFAFYKRGWRGMNVDAAPGTMKAFDLVRRRDINLNVAVGSEPGAIEFFCWGYPSVFNTADPDVARERAIVLGRQPATVTVPCYRLADLLEEHMPAGSTLRLLSVDVEGRDLDVLQSNDRGRYRPELLIAETYATAIEAVLESELHNFMRSQHYELLAWLRPSIIFRDTRSSKD